jgi:hypothetical protein
LIACGDNATTAPPRDGGLETETPDAGEPDATADAPADSAQEDAALAINLEGSWYADPDPAPPDGGPPPQRRRRFIDQTYFEAWSESGVYCAETGTFHLAGATLSLAPISVAGASCALGAARAETVSVTGTGLSFTNAGLVTRYSPIRSVPKMFETPERHAGDLAGDTTLAGANAIAKADAFCNASAGRPDALGYKALLVDGMSRSAVPPLDWVLLPNTTYFQADGTLNLFHTMATGLADPTANHPTQPVDDGYQWTGLGFDFTTSSATCAGWTSVSSTDFAPVAQAANTTFAFSSSVGVQCDALLGLLCVSQ